MTTLLMFDGFDGRLNFENGWNAGDIYNAWGLADGSWDGSGDGYPNGVIGIESNRGRYGGAGNSASLPQNEDYDGNWQEYWYDLDARGISAAHWALGCAFKGVGSWDLVQFGSKDGSLSRALTYVDLDVTGTIQVRVRNPGGSTLSHMYLSSVSPLLRVNQYEWNYFFMTCGIGLGANNDYMKMWLNGWNIMSFTNLTLSDGYGVPKWLQFPSTGETDDIFIAYDAATEISSGPFGEARSLALMPVSDGGDSVGFTANGAANLWDCVDEVNFDFDTTYNSSTGTSGDKHSVVCSSINSQMTSGEVASIQGVMVKVLASADAAEQIRPYLKIGGTRYYGTAVSPPSGRYEYAYYIWQTNPNTAAAWQHSELTALEIGYEVV